MPVDLVIVRENTEDLYAGIEFERGKPETAELIEFINKISPDRHDQDGRRRDRHLDQADQRPRHASGSCAAPSTTPATTAARRSPCVHKANIMKYTDGLCLAVARNVAKEYPDIEFEDRIVDNMCMQLVQKPELYDVLVLPNLYGDILSDLAAGLVGGLGVAPGANIGPNGAVFEATHGSAPKYKGQNKVNPTALILSGMLMLRHLGETDAADAAGKGRGRRDRRRQGRHLRPEGRPQRPHRRRHPRNGRGDLQEAVDARLQSACRSAPMRTASRR